ncbi:MAG: hypothetical protein M0C28_46840 [Candidatus Moduliflexus flocculans]|nr:hypothetical protein [Candidatus Moduliflexus flocculans]
MVGKSLFLFPEPVAELAEVCRHTQDPDHVRCRPRPGPDRRQAVPEPAQGGRLADDRPAPTRPSSAASAGSS